MAIQAAWLEPATLVTAVGALVALITLVAMLWWRQRDRRRRKVTYAVSFTSLLSDAAPRTAGGPIQVTFDGRPIEDPHLLTLRVDMRGPRDISNSDFNGGKPLVFHFGVPLIAPVGETIGVEDGDLNIAAGSFSIGPRLIRKGMVARIQIIADGIPEITMSSSLIDVDVREMVDAGQGGSMMRKVLTWAAIAFVIYYLATTNWLPKAGASLAGFLNNLTIPMWVVVPVLEAAIGIGFLIWRWNRRGEDNDAST